MSDDTVHFMRAIDKPSRKAEAIKEFSAEDLKRETCAIQAAWAALSPLSREGRDRALHYLTHILAYEPWKGPGEPTGF